MDPSLNYSSVPPPSYSSIEQNNTVPDLTHIPLAVGGPPYLPALVRGQKVQSGPYIITVTDSLVRERERHNQEIYRIWIDNQRHNFIHGREDEYFAEFKNAQIRRIFIKKVFFILFIQFLFTSAYIAFFMFYLPAKLFIVKYWWIWIIAMIAFVLSYCSISITDCGRRQSKWGVTCLIILTMAESHLSAFISVHFKIEVVLIAVALTASMTIIISLAATCLKFDFTKWAGILSILTIIGAIGLVVLAIMIMVSHIPILTMIFGIFGALIFSLYLYFDIQTIMGGKKIQLSPNEVIFATTQLYVDIIGLYRYLLLAVGSTSQS